MTVGTSGTTKQSRSRERVNENVQLDPAGERELELQDIGQQISRQQLESILGQSGLQDLLTGQTQQAFSSEALAQIEARAGQAGTLTDAERSLIDEAGSQRLASGEADIKRFAQEGLGLLREELAPSRGLRPSDTPIIDRGGKIIRRAIGEQGQLVRSIGEQSAQAKLQFPLQRQAFQEQLRNQAFQNRLGLAGLTAGSGLQLANTGNFLGSQKLLLEERIASPRTEGLKKTTGRGNEGTLTTEFDFGSLFGGGGG